MYLTNYDPIFDTLRGAFLRSLNDGGDGAPAHYLTPPVDVKEEDARWSFLLDLPGIKPSEIDVHVDGGDLVVEASHAVEHKEERDKYTHIERHGGSYRRRFALPKSADPEAIAARIDNGVLHITVEKKEDVKPKKITVSVS